MANITFKGQAVHTAGDLPQLGQVAPDFILTKTDLSEMHLSTLKGKRIILNIFSSLDTPTCANSVRQFNQEACKLNNVEILCISMDLPFAQSRFCGAEGLDKVILVSAFRHSEFGRYYGVMIADGPLTGLFARAVVVIDADGKVIYTQLVSEIADEPDYAAALHTLK